MTEIDLVHPWLAPHADGPVRGAVCVPGSKSMTNRALLCAALADGTSSLRGALTSRDSSLMSAGLSAFGAHFALVDSGDTLVTGAPPPFEGDSSIDVGLAGTVARFLPPVAALGKGRVRFDGDEQMRRRPIGELIAGMRAVGVEVEDAGRGALPITVRGQGYVPGGTVALDAAQSSQLVSGLLLAAPYFAGGIDLSVTGDLPSAPHVAMTVEMMRRAGADVDSSRGRWRVHPGSYEAHAIQIEPDVTSASYFFAAAAITGGAVTVTGWPVDSVQPSDQVLGVFTAMGVRFAYMNGGLTATGPGVLSGIDVDMHDISELTPTIAALAALASGPTTIRGVAHIRLHETDRLAALATELNGLGGNITETADGLVIHPRRLSGGLWRTYADHRMAMSGAVLGLVVPGLRVEDIACTSKTMPDFAQDWRALVQPA